MPQPICSSTPESAQWLLNGLSININGLNRVTSSIFQSLLQHRHLLFLQESKFSSADRLQSCDYFLQTTDASARSFWSHSTFLEFTGHHGVGIIITGNPPFGPVVDKTATYASNPLLNNRYILLETTFHEHLLFLHCIYAPVHHNDCPPFFEALPPDFPADAQHVMGGDFNQTLDPNMDQGNGNDRHHQHGREQLLHWMSSLHLLDDCRLTHPDIKEFTGPKLRHRLDYCLFSFGIFDDYFQTIQHCSNKHFFHADHVPIAFTIASRDYPLQTRKPWRCPLWLLQDKDVQAHLQSTLAHLLTTIMPYNNPGCLLDEHKRKDSVFLRRTFTEIRHHHLQYHELLLRRVRDLESFSTSPSNSPSSLQRARLELQANTEAMKEIHRTARFKLDLYQTENCSNNFFRPPTPPTLQLAITAVTLPDGSLSKDQSTIARLHRRYWGHIFRST